MIEEVSYLIHYLASGKTQVSSTSCDAKLSKEDLALIYQKTHDGFSLLKNKIAPFCTRQNQNKIWYSHRRNFKRKTTILLFSFSGMVPNTNIIEMVASLFNTQNIKQMVSTAPHLCNHYSITLPVQLLHSKVYIAPEQLEYDFLKCSITIDKYPIKHKFNDHYIVLSVQQSNILLSLSKGEGYKEISQKYNITPKTIEHYINIIKAKTGYRSKLELACAFRSTNMWL